MDLEYKSLLKDIYQHGERRSDRTGVGTKSIFGVQAKFDISEDFPALTLRKVPARFAFEELKFMLSGKTQTKELEEKNIRIWTGNTSREFQKKVGLGFLEEGDMGKMYGYQWRNFNGECVDQILELIEGLVRDPYSRRHITTMYNPAQSHQGVLYPCHILNQYYISHREGGPYLDSLFYMRSTDTVYGLPINIMFYAMLNYFIADFLQVKPGMLTYQGGDAHIYNNQMDMVCDMIKVREPKQPPKLVVKRPIESITDILTLEWGKDVELVGYDPHPDYKNKPKMAQ